METNLLTNRIEVVVVKLTRSSDGIAPVGAAALISPEGVNEYNPRIRQNDSDLTLLTQFAPGEFEARFDAAWDGDNWKLYGRRR